MAAGGGGGIADEKQAPAEAFGGHLEVAEMMEDEQHNGGESSSGVKSRLSGLLWHGGSAYDAWFSCASNQVAQVLLTLPYSFAQLGMLSGILFQLFYGLLGSWTAYLISALYLEYRTRRERDKVDFRNHVIQWFEVLDGLLGRHWRNAGLAFNCTFLLFGSVIQLIGCASNIYYVNDRLDKRTWTYVFGACCATTVFIPSFHNYRVWSFLGLVMTTYTAWYIAVASLVRGQVEGVQHSGPTTIVLYFTGATNILYTFGGHAVTVEIMHAMWRPQKFKAIYLLATLYVLTLTLPSAAAAYWAFGDELLTHSNALALLPRTPFRDAAVVLMLIHQFITFGFACTPLYFVWEKLIGLHDCRSLCKRAAARLPVVVPIWFLAIIFPFFGPINSAVGSLLVSFTVYIIPALAHMVTFRSPQSRENAVERPPRFAGGWTGAYVINSFVVAWVLVVGFGFGGWASITNFVQQVNNFGLFAKCYQCPPHLTALPAAPAAFAPPPMDRAPSMPQATAFNATGGLFFPPVPAPAPAPSPMINFFLRHHHHRHHGGRHGL
ncbi:auxin transporter-like protein 3 [Miscanthus floridulus]|uniref:auxin transporter-like protein 3 n=1 Tax=Miscanthus floridulus TaxID=154761 RepID=UPI003459BA47